MALRPQGERALHYVVIDGIDSARGLVTMNDPADRKMLSEERAAFEKDWSATEHWMLLAVPALNALFRYVVAEKIGTIILSAIVAHQAWHWMTDRWSALSQYQFQWPALDTAFAVSAMRWLMLVLVLVVPTIVRRRREVRHLRQAVRARYQYRARGRRVVRRQRTNGIGAG